MTAWGGEVPWGGGGLRHSPDDGVLGEPTQGEGAGAAQRDRMPVGMQNPAPSALGRSFSPWRFSGLTCKLLG